MVLFFSRLKESETDTLLSSTCSLRMGVNVNHKAKNNVIAPKMVIQSYYKKEKCGKI